MVSGETVDGEVGERRPRQGRGLRIEVDDECGTGGRGETERSDAMKDRVRAEESPSEHGGRSYGPAPDTGTP